MDVVAYPRVRAVISERVTPLKPLEVMAMGKVCVASDVGGLTELIDDGKTGKIFRSGDATQLVDVLSELAAAPTLMKRLGESGLAYVKREREWVVIVKRYQELYARLLETKRGVPREVASVDG
jgi:glycosyltransferase involved in cell wall biosynthesis